MNKLAKHCCTFSLGIIATSLVIACSSESSEDRVSAESYQPLHLVFEPIETSPGAIASFRGQWRPATTQAGVSRNGLTSHISNVSLQNDPSDPVAFNGTTFMLEGGVVLTSNGGTDLDEPRVTITSVTGFCGAGCGDVQFLNSDYGTPTNVGASLAYPDVTASGGADNTSRRRWSVYAPGGVSFDFTADVFAEDTPTSVVVDADDDYFNDEPGEPAGGDCDDSDSSIFPGGNFCPNPGTCDTGSCNSAQANCCEDFCSGTSCTLNCAAGNDCFFEGAPGKNFKGNCFAGSTCHVSHDSPNNARMVACDDATCGMICNGTGSKCFFANNACVNSSCSLQCNGISNCEIVTCDGDSTCRVDCTNADTACGINNCANETASCMVQCGANVPNCSLSCDVGTAIDCGSGVLVCPGTPCP